MIKKGASWFAAKKLTKVKNIHKAVYSFRQPRRKSDLIPTCALAWQDYFVKLLKKKAVVRKLTPRELEHVITKARVLVAEKYNPKPTFEDLPSCYLWSDKQVGEWLISIGFGILKEPFYVNNISGRKIIRISPKFLFHIGMRDIADINVIYKNIRHLLGLPPTSTKLLRDPLTSSVYEEYLWERSYTGKTYDTLTFRNYWQQRGLPMDAFVNSPVINKNLKPDQ